MGDTWPGWDDCRGMSLAKGPAKKHPSASSEGEDEIVSLRELPTGQLVRNLCERTACYGV